MYGARMKRFYIFPPSRNPRARRSIAPLLLVAALAMALGACDKCGDWHLGSTQKTCHDTSETK
jgi:hypothetical protein